jgi:hypothetical protein
MNTTTVKEWFAHYFLGLLAQSFNGAIATISGLVALDSTGQLANGITFDAVWKTFTVALGIQAILYFHEHPFPVLNPDSLVTKTTVETTSTSTTKTALPGTVATSTSTQVPVVTTADALIKLSNP